MRVCLLETGHGLLQASGGSSMEGQVYPQFLKAIVKSLLKL